MNFFKRNTGLLIRFDDIAENMNWDLMEKCEKLFFKYNIKPVLGIIPNNKDDELLSFPVNKNFWEKVKNWQSNNWEIAIHGYNHKYSTDTQKRDFFRYGGKSEFFGKPLDEQIFKIKNSLEIFKKKNINVRCFFAPNHTYDLNTFEALKIMGINQVIDGYGFFPYSKFGIKFIPQLFYNIKFFPFGIQTTQIHLNTWTKDDYDEFEKFIIKNHEKVITYDFALSKLNDKFYNRLLTRITRDTLIFLRLFKFKS